MGYYQGDFYAGARGDPGIGSFFVSLIKGAVGLIPGVGPIASKAIERIGAATAGRGSSSIVKAAKCVIMKHPVLSAAGAAGIVGVGAGAVGSRMIGGGR